jgi:ubiquinone/menaquinone biosynthesis C-methylase UbiE
MGLKRYVCGNEMERMPDMAFRAMSGAYKVMDLFYPFERYITGFGIGEGFTVVDYGCGPGRYTKRMSRLVGEQGKVYALDIHHLAIQSVKRKIRKYNLHNVEPILVDGYSCHIDDHTADAVYALDMFHMIKHPAPFLNELRRIVKESGFLIIGDGNQPRAETRAKILISNYWNIADETKHHLTCTPI